ncbi:MAG: endonuclease III [Candidatus Micrarchaeota archaeon]|nr:endonuclease III [Candidatus Micrarchaeota archaeon]
MQEAFSAKRKRALRILSLLKRAYPDARCSLHYRTPLQLLIATILSAQCTDERVNRVTPALFAQYKTARDFANAPLAKLQSLIRQTGFYRNKAKNIKRAATLIVRRFGGQVPRTMRQMLELPGVARKTANIVLGNAYGVVEGIPIDTHAIRISRLLGLTEERNPVKIERDLMALFPRRDWLAVSNLFVFHGRAICVARRPLCSKCPLSRLCPKRGLPASWRR